jgi:hypothetical protein
VEVQDVSLAQVRLSVAGLDFLRTGELGEVERYRPGGEKVTDAGVAGDDPDGGVAGIAPGEAVVLRDRFAR